MRKYWIQYRVVLPTGETRVSEVEITRDKPISETRDLFDISSAIMNGLIENRAVKRGDGTNVSVIAWTAFESPIVLLQ